MGIINNENVNKKATLAKVRKMAKVSANNGTLTTTFNWKNNKYFYNTYTDKLVKVDKTARNYTYFKKIQTPFKYKVIYQAGTGTPYITEPAARLQRAKYNFVGDGPQPSNLKEFFQTLKAYYSRSFGDYIKLQDGKIKSQNQKHKGKLDYVKLVFHQWSQEADGTWVKNLEQRSARAIRVKSFVDFKRQIDKIENSKSISGSDEIGDNYRLETSTFEIRNMLKTSPFAITGDGSNLKFDLNPHYKFKNCADHYCGIACVKTSLGDKRAMKTIVKELEDKFEDLENGISFENLNVLEKYFNCSINVYDWKVKDFMLRVSTTENDKVVNLIYYTDENDLIDGHYLLMLGDRKPKVLKRKRDREYAKVKLPIKEFFLFYDVETTYNRFALNELEVYSCAWFCWEKGKEFNYDKSMLAKCNYADIRTGRPLKAFLDWIYANECGDTYDGVFHKHKFIITGFNSSRFDNFFLMDEGLREDMVRDILFVQNSVLNFNMGRHSGLDLCRFIASSLKGACASFKTNPKKLEGFSHTEPQEAFEKGELIKWIETNEDKLIEYNKLDVLSLVDLTLKYDKANKKLLNADFSKCNTISGLSWECFSETNTFDIKAPLDAITDTQIRKSLTAGRTQTYFGKNKFSMGLRMVDVVSLYPFVMMNRRFPIGEYKTTDNYVSGKLGIYSCEIIHQNLKWKNEGKVKKSFNNFYNKDPFSYVRMSEGQKKYAPVVYPKRTEDEPLDWNYRGSMFCNLSSIDIENIRDYGGEVNVIQNWKTASGDLVSGIYWEEDTELIFKEFLGKCMNEKNEQDELKKLDSPDYNPALREACKLVSNSLSGKVIQRNFEETMMFIKDSKALDKFLEKTEESTQIIEFFGNNVIYGKGKLKEEHIYKEQKAKPSYLGIFIYAHARNYMYETLLGSYTCIYQDTDSALLPIWEYERLISEKGDLFPFNRNKKYGDLEEEVGDANIAYTIAPKCYAVLNKDDEEALEQGLINYQNKCSAKRKFKGIKGNDKWELFYLESKKEFRKDYNLNDTQIQDKLANEKKVFTGNMMEQLFLGNKIMIYTSQLVKKVCENNEIVKNDTIINDEILNKGVSFGIYQRFMVKII